METNVCAFFSLSWHLALVSALPQPGYIIQYDDDVLDGQKMFCNNEGISLYDCSLKSFSSHSTARAQTRVSELEWYHKNTLCSKWEGRKRKNGTNVHIRYWCQPACGQPNDTNIPKFAKYLIILSCYERRM